MGIHAIASVYVVLTWFPPRDAWLSGVVAFATPIAGIVSAGIVWMMPSYIAWQADLHRQQLQRAGAAPHEIEAEVAARHQHPIEFLAAGASAVILQGLLGAVPTTGVGGAAAIKRVRADRPET